MPCGDSDKITCLFLKLHDTFNGHHWRHKFGNPWWLYVSMRTKKMHLSISVEMGLFRLIERPSRLWRVWYSQIVEVSPRSWWGPLLSYPTCTRPFDFNKICFVETTRMDIPRLTRSKILYYSSHHRNIGLGSGKKKRKLFTVNNPDFHSFFVSHDHA